MVGWQHWSRSCLWVAESPCQGPEGVTGGTVGDSLEPGRHATGFLGTQSWSWLQMLWMHQMWEQPLLPCAVWLYFRSFLHFNCGA